MYTYVGIFEYLLRQVFLFLLSLNVSCPTIQRGSSMFSWFSDAHMVIWLLTKFLFVHFSKLAIFVDFLGGKLYHNASFLMVSTGLDRTYPTSSRLGRSYLTSRNQFQRPKIAFPSYQRLGKQRDNLLSPSNLLKRTSRKMSL